MKGDYSGEGGGEGTLGLICSFLARGSTVLHGLQHHK